MSATIKTSPRVLAKTNTAALTAKWQNQERPLALTISGRLQYEINDDTSFQMLLALVERLDNIAAIQEGLDDVAAGRTVSLDEFTQQVRDENGI